MPLFIHVFTLNLYRIQCIELNKNDGKVFVHFEPIANIFCRMIWKILQVIRFSEKKNINK
jgi:hypothetical protein